MRLGSYTDGRFTAGVTRDIFEQLLQDMQETQSLREDEGWTEMIDYHYTAQRDVKVRTRVSFDSQRMEMHTEHLTKESQQTVVFRRAEEDAMEACRIAWAKETPYPDPPQTCMPTFVRIKQRKTFRDVRHGVTVWSYELSKTWSAGSRSAVEHKQNMSPPTYEVECELIDEDGAYLASHTDEEVGASLLLKSALLLGEGPDAKLDILSKTQGGPEDAAPES